MKFTVATVCAALAATASAAFDKNQPWGKRDYSCINVYQGIPDNATVIVGGTVEMKFNRHTTTHCSDALTKYPGSDYSLWLYNNPRQIPNGFGYDQRIQITTGIKESSGKTTFTVPKNLPAVKDKTVWYLRLDTSLDTAPQMPTLFNVQGPFTIATS